jgi:predicted transcriptional regulator of viral defense system/very-short-patch-repair endonuclease
MRGRGNVELQVFRHGSMKKHSRADSATGDAGFSAPGALLEPAPAVGRRRRIAAEAVALEFASRQHALVARRQLLQAGVRSEWIERRLASRWLHRVHRGVYRVGPIVAPLMAEMAAVLACDGVATISHYSAARLWQLLGPPAGGAGAATAVHVITPVRRTRPGIHVHLSVALPADEVTMCEGIPATTPARTLLDLAALPATAGRELERALAEAYALRRVTSGELAALVARHPRHLGAARLRQLMASETPPARTRSEAEAKFRELMRLAQITVPAWNAVVSAFELDCWWPEERFAVEIDGYAYHGSRRRYEGDRRRDGVLAAAGIQVMRVTWKQMVEEPLALVARLSRALARRGR